MSTHQPVPGGEQAAREWVDLAANLPGAGIVGEAARRRRAEGAGADRSWRVGADGEVAVAALLAELTDVGRWGRLRGRRPDWRVLHSVPLGDGHGNQRGDIDHVLIGPPGVVTINTKHHRTGRLELDGEHVVPGGSPTTSRRHDARPPARPSCCGTCFRRKRPASRCGRSWSSWAAGSLPAATRPG